MDCWQKIGIAETADKREIKRAYAKLIKLHHPESDPEEFQAVREAYEQALWLSDRLQHNKDESVASLPAPESATESVEEPQTAKPIAPALREKEKVRTAQIETIDAALAELIPLLQRDETLAIAFCRTKLNESFFQALDARYEFEGKLLIALLQHDIFALKFLKYVTKEFDWDVNMTRPGRIVIGHFDNDVRYSGAFYAVARRYLSEIVRGALRVHIQNTHSWMATERFDRLEALLFTEASEAELAEFCKGKQERELVESAISFLVKNRYITNQTSFVPWKTVQWLIDKNIARPPGQPKQQTQPQVSQPEGRSWSFPGWAIGLVLVVAIRLIASLGSNPHSTQPVSMPSVSSSSANYAAPPEQMTRVMQLIRDAETGDKEAQYKVGSEYLRGTTLSEDTKQALKWMQRSADQDYAPAREVLGIWYYTGGVGAQDYKLAMKHLQWAADHDRPDATYWLGKAYYDGEAVEQNIVKGRALMDRATKLGSTEALRANIPTPKPMSDRALLDRSELKRNTQQYASSRQDPLISAAENGNRNAAYNLGVQYLTGYQRELNYNEAFKWLNTPSVRETPLGQVWLSQLYEKGLGVQRDKRQSQQLFHRAEQTLSPDGLNNVAMHLTFHPNKDLRNGELAASMMERMLADPANQNAARFNTLAGAYAEAGQFAKAIAAENQAIAALTTDPKATLDKRAEYDERLKRFEKGQTAFR